MELKTLSCTRCGANISERSLTEPVISCDYCGCIFLLSGNIQNEDRAIIPIPENMSMNSSDGRFILTYKWKSVSGIILMIFGAFFLIFSLFWTTLAFSGGGIFGIFGLFFVGFSFFLIYMGIAFTVNKTVIHIANSLLSIKFIPLFCPGAKIINVKEIVQLYVQRKEYHNKDNTTYSYSIIALLKGNKSIALLKMIQEPEIAKCVEQQLERYLGIKDISIAGEYKT